MSTRSPKETRQPTMAESVIVLLTFVAIVAVGYMIFRLKIEVLMILSAIFAAIMAMRCGYNWEQLEAAICKKIYQATPAILIMWTIGIVIGSLMYCGTIPMVIYFGLKFIDPKLLYLCTFLICCLMSVVTGTSWGSAGTIGVAMMGVAAGLDASLPITAGAVVSGVIFGDKLSPLSETTNLAPLCAGCGLYEHIGSMMYSSILPAIASAVVYWFVGLRAGIVSNTLPESALALMDGLNNMYRWNALLLLPFVVILIGALLKKPPVPTMVAASLLALAIGWLNQGFDLASGTRALINGFTTTMIYSNNVSSDISSILNRGGMAGMVSIVIVLYCGYAYTAIISEAGFLETAIRPLMRKISNRVQLITMTLLCDFFIMACSGSSYPAHIVTADIFKQKFKNFDLHPKVLSRTLEDVGTMMAPLIPWAASGAFYMSTLGVPIFGKNGFAVWAINTYTNPVMAIILATTGIGMFRLSDSKRM